MYIESLARRVRNIIEREKGDRKWSLLADGQSGVGVSFFFFFVWDTGSVSDGIELKNFGKKWMEGV